VQIVRTILPHIFFVGIGENVFSHYPIRILYGKKAAKAWKFVSISPVTDPRTIGKRLSSIKDLILII